MENLSIFISFYLGSQIYTSVFQIITLCKGFVCNYFFSISNINLIFSDSHTVKYIQYGIYFLVLLILALLYVRKRKHEVEIKNRIQKILEEFNDKREVFQEVITEVEISESKTLDSISITEEVENDILEKLKKLDEQKYYLRLDFTQQSVAKKIKTNTTYLSLIFNKRYGKSFSAYYNELRISYVIDEMITNSKFRSYTTQAIAECAGFKNADSFTTSFKRKTGVTPFQFIRELNKNNS